MFMGCPCPGVGSGELQGWPLGEGRSWTVCIGPVAGHSELQGQRRKRGKMCSGCRSRDSPAAHGEPMVEQVFLHSPWRTLHENGQMFPERTTAGGEPTLKQIFLTGVAACGELHRSRFLFSLKDCSP